MSTTTALQGGADREARPALRKFVLGFAFNPTGSKLLLQRKLKPAWMRGRLNGLGGKVESFDANHLAAMEREWIEESLGDPRDAHPALWEKRGTLTGPAWDVTIFRTFLPESTLHQIVHDTVNARKRVEACGVFECERLPRSVLPNLHWIVPMLLDEHLTTFSALEG